MTLTSASTDGSTRQEHWRREGSGGPVLIGGRCDSCGRHFFPHRPVCPDCYAIDRMRPVELSRRGQLYAFSVVRTPVRGYTVPYAIGYVDLPEGVRVFAQIEGWEQLELDTEVELTEGVISTSAGGEPVVGYKFRPVHREPSA